MKRFNVTAGRDFEVEAIELIDVRDVAELSKINVTMARERRRVAVSYLILGSIGVALLIATIVGIYDGSLNEVSSVWAAAAVPLGLILRAYFDKPAPT